MATMANSPRSPVHFVVNVGFTSKFCYCARDDQNSVHFNLFQYNFIYPCYTDTHTKLIGNKEKIMLMLNNKIDDVLLLKMCIYYYCHVWLSGKESAYNVEKC